MELPITIILAGGLGKRMNSDLPKVLHLVAGKPMLYWVVKKAREISKKILIVVGKYKKQIQQEMLKYFKKDYLIYVDQPEETVGFFNPISKVKGTGNAIACCLPYLNDEPFTDVLILSGDVPLINVDTLKNVLAKKNTVLIKNTNKPTGYGRIIFENECIVDIVEEKDCTEEQKNINFVNGGIYNLTIDTLQQTIPEIKNVNEAKEYYLTDFVKIAKEKKINIYTYELPESQAYELVNINTQEDLSDANNFRFYEF